MKKTGHNLDNSLDLVSLGYQDSLNFSLTNSPNCSVVDTSSGCPGNSLLLPSSHCTGLLVTTLMTVTSHGNRPRAIIILTEGID